MKSFSTVRDTHRGSQSYMEKRKGRREIEVTRRRRGGIKREESKLASNHFLMCAPQSGLLRDVHGVIQRREEPRDLLFHPDVHVHKVPGHYAVPGTSHP